MEISRNDVMLLLIMSLAIVSMSMVFPALGLSDNTVQASDIPELNVTEDRVNFSQPFPPAPGSPNNYTITYKNNSTSINQVYLEGDTTGGVEMFIAPPNYNHPDHGDVNDPVVILNKWEAGNVTFTEQFNYTVGETTNYYTNESLGYRLGITFTENNDTAGVYSARIEVISEVSNAGWLTGVPLIGSMVEGGQEFAAVLWWVVEVMIWGVLVIVQGGANFLGVVVDVLVYLVGLMAWLATTYTGIVSSASTWAATFVALPGIIFSALLGKLVIIGMQTLAQLR